MANSLHSLWLLVAITKSSSNGIYQPSEEFSRGCGQFYVRWSQTKAEMFFCLGALKADHKLLHLMSESDPVLLYGKVEWMTRKTQFCLKFCKWERCRRSTACHGISMGDQGIAIRVNQGSNHELRNVSPGTTNWRL